MAGLFPNLSFDCCGVMTPENGEITDAFLLSLIGDIGAKRIMFGSDFPFIDPVPQLQRIRALDLTQEEKQLILVENAKRILKL